MRSGSEDSPNDAWLPQANLLAVVALPTVASGEEDLDDASARLAPLLQASLPPLLPPLY
jgi:hypothetical protein